MILIGVSRTGDQFAAFRDSLLRNLYLASRTKFRKDQKSTDDEASESFRKHGNQRKRERHVNAEEEDIELAWQLQRGGQHGKHK